MTLDVMCSSPYVIQGNLQGESSILSEVTWGFYPGTPSIIDQSQVWGGIPK